MTTPGGGIFSGPRMAGETRFAYERRRSYELYGMSPWERRIQRGLGRGLTRSQAGGRERIPEPLRILRPPPPPPEPPPPGPPYYGGGILQPTAFDWALDNGYTPEATGWSRGQISSIAYRLKWIYEHASPGSRITPAMIAQARALEVSGALANGWAYERTRQRYMDMRAYRESRDNTTGADSWRERQETQDEVPELPSEWWMYH